MSIDYDPIYQCRRKIDAEPFEVRLMDDCVFVRPADPERYTEIEQISYLDLAIGFENSPVSVN